jgi:hypothetical protein
MSFYDIIYHTPTSSALKEHQKHLNIILVSFFTLKQIVSTHLAHALEVPDKLPYFVANKE